MGGLPAATINMALAEATKDIETVVAATRASGGGSSPKEIDLGGVCGLLFSRTRFAPYSYSPSLNRWLKSHVAEYDVVEVHSVFSYPSLAAGRAARRARVPYVIHPHGSLDPFDLRKHRLLKRVIGPLLVRPLLAGAARVLTASKLEAERYRSFGAGAPVTTLPIPYLVKDDGAEPDAFRVKHGLQRRQIILFLGRINYKKGIEYLIDALPTVIAHHENAVLLLAGDHHSDYADRLRKRVEDAGLSAHIRFLGALNRAEKSSALAVADVFALVSDNENYGLVLVEAAWWGLPMLVSREVYIASQLDEAGAALVVDRSGPAVATGLILLLDDKAMREAMGERARQLAQTVFSWDVCCSSHAALRRELCKP